MAIKTCILCGAPGPLTREHIWPEWYSELHPDRRYRLDSIDKGKPAKREADSLDLQPRVLCHPCNHEWGSDLETAVRPALSRMTDGKEEIITLPLARRIAAWVTLKVMAGEYLNRSDWPSPFFSESQRSFLRTKTKPPQGVSIWIGRYVGQHHLAGTLRPMQSTHPHPEDSSIVAFLQSWGYSIGQVVFDVFAVRLVPVVPLTYPEQLSTRLFIPFSLYGDWSQALVPLWPLPETRFRWPPTYALDDPGYHAAITRWHQ